MSDNDHSVADSAAGFAGIGALANAAAGQGSLSKPRSYIEFTLPEKFLSPDFALDGFGDTDRTFRMQELKPHEQEAAAKLGGSNNAVIGRELLFAAISKIGEKSTKGAAGREMLERWWDAMGTRGNALIQQAFVKQQSVEEDDVAAFLDSGQAGRG